MAARKVNIKKCAGRMDSLYKRYPDAKDGAHPVNIYLDCRTGELSIAVDNEIGASADDLNGHIHGWGLPAVPTVEVANDLLERLKPLAARILAGYSQTNNGGHCQGVLNDDARNASIELIDAMEAVDENDYWPPSVQVDMVEADYYYQHADINVHADMTDDQIAKLAGKLDKQADAESEYGCLIVSGTEDFLRAKRDQKGYQPKFSSGRKVKNGASSR